MRCDLIQTEEYKEVLEIVRENFPDSFSADLTYSSEFDKKYVIRIGKTDVNLDDDYTTKISTSLKKYNLICLFLTLPKTKLYISIYI